MTDQWQCADATAADLDQIENLERASFPNPWRREFFASELRAEGRRNRILRADRAVVAYCFTMYFLDEMHVNKIAVAAPLRRQGLAALLMDDVVAFAKEKGIRTIALEVRESNQEARDFYEALAFEERYRRPRYYPDGEAAVVMVLDLPAGPGQI
ncbi:MAG: ribosomal protein S18-alanine N-acetyltransferase [Thermoanaerobaculia bacterium]